MESSFLQSAGVQNLLKSLGCASLPNGRIVDTYDPKWRHLRTEGIGADGLSGQVDNNGPTGPSGGSPYSGEEEDQLQPPVSQIERRQDVHGDTVIMSSDNKSLNGACPFCGSRPLVDLSGSTRNVCAGCVGTCPST